MSLRPFDDLNVHACMNLRFSVFAQLNNTFTAPSIEVRYDRLETLDGLSIELNAHSA